MAPHEVPSSTAPNGYTCNNCGQWVTFDSNHFYRNTWNFGGPQPQPYYFDTHSPQLVAVLERIAAALEKLVEKRS